MAENLYIGIGSNQGNSSEFCLEAIKLINQQSACEVILTSRLFLTEPFGLKEQPWFVNCAAAVKTKLNPTAFLNMCLDIEHHLHRERLIKWGPRTVDIDILLWEKLTLHSKKLIIPHPYLHLRRFALVPLNEIGHGTFHPLFGETISSLLENLNDSCEVIPL